VSLFRSLLVAAVIAPTGWPATLALSTYLKDGFTPAAIASDAQGNIYLAGSAVIDPAAQTTSAVVAKLDPKLSQYLYLAYFDSAANDQVSAIAIDGAGNAYITGSTVNPNFPVVGGATLGTAPTSDTDTRPFVTKLDPQGAVVFSVLIGSTTSTGLGIALAPQGQVLVSGIATKTGFPTTTGAYTVADSTNQWFLLELNAAADAMVFSATGIGGSSIALDAAGNIYLAGSSVGTTYPTTPGAYQTKFVQSSYCYGLCQFDYLGNLQHVTKIDPAASKLIYSTGLNNSMGFAGSTTNTGLAVDAQGNAYVTGTLFNGEYPFTVPATSLDSYLTFLTKLDPAGANALFSIPVGGAGVQLDSSGALYAGGFVASYNSGVFPVTTPVAPPPVFSWIPQPCWPDNVVADSEAYVVKVDPATGDVLDGQWIDGSAPGATAITWADGKVWITGATPGPDVLFSPGALAPANLGPGFLQGAYLSAADFSAGVNDGPEIGCVLDGGNLTHVGAVAAFQLLSIFGAKLGSGTSAVSVTFDGNPAPLLYVSESQINVAVVAPPLNGPSVASATVMEVTVNGVSIQRQFPFTLSNLNLFASRSPTDACDPNGFQPLAVNADGALNSCTNPAKYGSTVSFFLHGAGGVALGEPAPTQLLNLEALVGYCAPAITNAPVLNGFVYRVDVVMPASQLPCMEIYSAGQALTSFPVTFSYNGLPVGPLAVPSPAYPNTNFPLPMYVWVTQ
jgi:uncharacterized protein (TIGR03437 family)